AWLWYKPLAEVATIEPDLHEQLEKLREMGLKLAIISNTFSPPSVLDRHLDKLDLLKFFDFRQYSSVTVFRKPDRRIFDLTLKQLGTTAAEAVMVGDKIRPDIKGALRAGLRPVFKRNRVNHAKRLSESIAQISRIGELPGLIRKWNCV
ncbi:MAG: HAD-IA family hydrolase, partial [Phycisphaerae bacterium]|nr:HAD-IA family hydrolase [Phycisphaerae bacterium]